MYMGFYIGCVGKFVALFDCCRPFNFATIRTSHCLQEGIRQCLEGNVQTEWGADALVEKDPVHKEWQDVKNLVVAE